MRATGFKKARSRSRRRVAALDDGTKAAIAKTVDEVHRAGSENIEQMVTERSGRLKRFYRTAFRQGGAIGLVGYVSARARSSAFYARFVHDGTSRQRARPFHDRAVLEFVGKHAGRMRVALSNALSGKGSPSGLGRTGGGRERDL